MNLAGKPCWQDSHPGDGGVQGDAFKKATSAGGASQQTAGEAVCTERRVVLFWCLLCAGSVLAVHAPRRCPARRGSFFGFL